MRGDEAGLGTPAEDMSSLAAVSKLNGIEGFVASIGFGIDAFHGVCHSLVLENIASMTRKGGYLGAFSVTPDSAVTPPPQQERMWAGVIRDSPMHPGRTSGR